MPWTSTDLTRVFWGQTVSIQRLDSQRRTLMRALLKQKAIKQAKHAYVLADPSKFGEISFSAFAGIGDATIITTDAEELTFDNYQEKLS